MIQPSSENDSMMSSITEGFERRKQMQVLAGLGALIPWAFKARSMVTAGLAAGVAIDVPFDFVMGTFSLSAGTYRFEALSSPTPGVCVLVARAETGKAYKLAVSTPSIRSHGGSRF